VEIRVAFCSERDHAPVEHGVLTYDLRQHVWTAAHSNACVQRQAECAVESFLQRRQGHVTGHEFTRAATPEKNSGALAPAQADDRSLSRAESRGPKPAPSGVEGTDDLPSSHPPLLPVDVAVR
jgi:hypothetical protein